MGRAHARFYKGPKRTAGLPREPGRRRSIDSVRTPEEPCMCGARPVGKAPGFRVSMVALRAECAASLLGDQGSSLAGGRCRPPHVEVGVEVGAVEITPAGSRFK